MIALAIVILAWLLVGCVFMVLDINYLCAEQAEEARLDELWGDE